MYDYKDLVEDFIENLKYYRKKKNWSQSELAIQVDVSSSHIGNIEAGKTFPSPKTFVKIAAALGVHPADLILRDSSKSQNRKLYSKYDDLIQDFEGMPDYQRSSLKDYVRSLAESTPKYGSGKK